MVTTISLSTYILFMTNYFDGAAATKVQVLGKRSKNFARAYRRHKMNHMTKGNFGKLNYI